MILALVLVASGCAPKIPNQVGLEEYDVYSAWLRQRFEKEPPHRLILAIRTFPFSSCKRLNWGMDRALVTRLAELGDAQYPLQFFARDLHIPWKFEQSDAFPFDMPTDESGTFQVIHFSRVAFNAWHTRGLFAVNSVCGGLCGSGGVLLALRENGSWTFHSTGCIWVS